MDECKSRVSQKSSKSLYVSLCGQVQVDQRLGLWHETAPLPVDAPRICSPGSKRRGKSATACEDLQAEGAIAISDVVAVVSEAPLGRPLPVALRTALLVYLAFHDHIRNTRTRVDGTTDRRCSS